MARPAAAPASASSAASPASAAPSPASSAEDAAPSAGPPAAASSPIPAGSGQLLLAVVDDWDDHTASMQRYERAGGEAWRAVGAAWPATIGVNGSAWGRGLHGQGAPRGRGGPSKREGDGKSPAGAFSLGGSYGYAASPVDGARAPYTRVDRSWICVDDPRSSHYNRVLDADRVAVDWSSREEMRRRDELYRWVVFVDHNADATPGAGSCIFLHVWSSASSGTAGCTAMERGAIEALLAWLDPAARPAFVLLPAGERDALRAAWSLP